MKLVYLCVCIGVLFFLLGCGDDGVPADPEVRDYSQFFTPLPEAALYPADNPFNQSKEQLGELLFWDPILSGDQNVACASCHHPDFGWADGRDVSIGSDGIGLGPARTGSQMTPLHSPTIMNVAFTGLASSSNVQESFVSGGYFWDLRADTLEEQVLGPIQNPVEMLGFNVAEQEIMNEIVMRLQAIPEYVALFDAAFDDDEPITQFNIAKAIATFERRIISPNTRFDDFLRGNQNVFTQAEIIGLNKFIDGGCARCHSGPMLSDNVLRENEIVMGNVAVRTPTLRNLAITAPFMHDGSSETLTDAIAVYDERGDLQVSIGEGDVADLEIFLRTLDTNNFYQQKPESVPSGLPVGGIIN